MSSRHRLFTVFYRLGFTPWDGHPLAATLRDLAEGDRALPPGTALDVGCGTGDTTIFLAEHGWRVTGADYVDRALAKARAKAAARGVLGSFVRADATRLSAEGIGSDFDLIVDNGCLHGMPADDRDAYVREVSAVAAPGAHLLIHAFVPGGSFGVAGIDPDEVGRRFAGDWTLRSTTVESGGAARTYLFTRS